MSGTEKRINKWLVGLIIGSAIIGAGSLSMTPKGKSFLRCFLDRAQRRGEWLAGLKTSSIDHGPDHKADSGNKADHGDDHDLVKE